MLTVAIAPRASTKAVIRQGSMVTAFKEVSDRWSSTKLASTNTPASKKPRRSVSGHSPYRRLPAFLDGSCPQFEIVRSRPQTSRPLVSVVWMVRGVSRLPLAAVALSAACIGGLWEWEDRRARGVPLTPRSPGPDAASSSSAPAYRCRWTGTARRAADRARGHPAPREPARGAHRLDVRRPGRSWRVAASASYAAAATSSTPGARPFRRGGLGSPRHRRKLARACFPSDETRRGSGQGCRSRRRRSRRRYSPRPSSSPGAAAR